MLLYGYMGIEIRSGSIYHTRKPMLGITFSTCDVTTKICLWLIGIFTLVETFSNAISEHLSFPGGMPPDLCSFSILPVCSFALMSSLLEDFQGCMEHLILIIIEIIASLARNEQLNYILIHLFICDLICKNPT